MAEAPERDFDIELNQSLGDADVIIWRAELVLKDAAGVLMPNITYGTLSTFSIARAHNQPPVLELSVGNGITVSPVSAKLVLEMTKAHVSALPMGLKTNKYVYDWDLVDGDNQSYRLMKGTLRFYGDIKT